MPLFQALFVVMFSGIVGLASLEIVPILLNSKLLIFALPVLYVVVLTAVLNPISVIYLIVYTRVLLEPLLNMSRTNVGGMNIGLGAMLNLMVLSYVLFTCVTNKANAMREHFLRWWAVYLSLLFISVIYGPQKTFAFRMWLNISSYFAMALLPFYIIKTLESRNNWIKHVLISSILPIMFANLDLIKGGAVDWSGMRIMGTFPHPNMLGFYLVLIIVISFLVLNSSRIKLTGRWRALLILYMINLFVLLLFTKTRNAWLACWLVFFLYGVFKDKRYLLLTIGLPPLMLLIPEFAYRITELMQGDYVAGGSAGQLNSWAWRTTLWQDSLVWIAKNPFLGYGFTSFKLYSNNFSTMAVEGGSGAHNVYIETLFENGVFGLVSFSAIFLSLMGGFLRRLIDRMNYCAKESALMLSYVISYALVCFADNMQYYLVLNWFVWFFVGCMCVPIGGSKKTGAARLDRLRNDNRNNSSAAAHH